jgi:hypothetical protein
MLHTKERNASVNTEKGLRIETLDNFSTHLKISISYQNVKY